MRSYFASHVERKRETPIFLQRNMLAGGPLSIVVSTHEPRFLFQSPKRTPRWVVDTSRGTPRTLVEAGPPPPPPVVDQIRVAQGNALKKRPQVFAQSYGSPRGIFDFSADLPSEQMLASAPLRRSRTWPGADSTRGTPKTLLGEPAAPGDPIVPRLASLPPLRRIPVVDTARGTPKTLLEEQDIFDPLASFVFARTPDRPVFKPIFEQSTPKTLIEEIDPGAPIFPPPPPLVPWLFKIPNDSTIPPPLGLLSDAQPPPPPPDPTTPVVSGGGPPRYDVLPKERIAVDLEQAIGRLKLRSYDLEWARSSSAELKTALESLGEALPPPPHVEARAPVVAPVVEAPPVDPYQRTEPDPLVDLLLAIVEQIATGKPMSRNQAKTLATRMRGRK